MKKHDLSDIESFVSGLFEEAPFCDRNIEVKAEGADVFITVSQMYEYVDCSFQTLKRLSDFFETENIGDADRWHSHGCETCDYGSKYTLKLRVSPDKVRHRVAKGE